MGKETKGDGGRSGRELVKNLVHNNEKQLVVGEKSLEDIKLGVNEAKQDTVTQLVLRKLGCYPLFFCS